MQVLPRQRFASDRPHAANPPSDWPFEEASLDIIYLSNVFHITNFETVGKGILAGAGRCLKPKGIFVCYGPFKIDGEFTKSNRAFDESLRNRDSIWGYRDIDADIAAYALKQGLVKREQRSMPANNFLAVFERA